PHSARLLITFSGCNVAADAGEKTLPVCLEFAEGDFQRYLAAVLVKSGKRHGLPGNMSLAGGDILLETRPMHVSQILGHQHGQLDPEHFFNCVAENLYCRAVDEDD